MPLKGHPLQSEGKYGWSSENIRAVRAGFPVSPLDALAVQAAVVRRGFRRRSPSALTSPLVAGYVIFPEGGVDGPDAVVEGHVRLAGIHGRRGQPLDIREHIGLGDELPHFRGPVRTLDGGIVLGAKP